MKKNHSYTILMLLWSVMLPLIIQANSMPKSIYVVGLESSGTRALTRLVAKMISSADQKMTWNGEYPPCVNNVHHVSLPYNAKCDNTMPIIKETFAPCGARLPPNPRFILNISHILQENNNAIAVMITRSLNSVWTSTQKETNGPHCNSLNNFLNETKLSLSVMTSALNDYPKKTFLVSYHNLAYFPNRTIYDISNFLNHRGWNARKKLDIQWHDRDYII